MTPEQKIGKILIQSQKKLSTAESCSGGLAGHRLTNVPGSSAYFSGGIIAYANEVKTKILGVPSFLLKKNGAVSAPTALKMASQARKLFKTDYGIGITGIAGPSGGSKPKPVGLVFIAVSDTKRTLCRSFRFKGRRIQIKNQAAEAALRLFLTFLK